MVVLNDRRGGSMIFGRRYPDLQGSGTATFWDGSPA
jgi:hypothetical protein